VSAALEAWEPSAKYLDALRPPLLRHFDAVARAPASIQRLRNLILALAVTGKLVRQDPYDEPAGHAVERLRQERIRLAAGAGLKGRRASPTAEPAAAPTHLPKGWGGIQLADVVHVLNGRAYSKGELLERGQTPVLRVGNLFTSNDWYYSDLELEPAKYCDQGDLLYAWSASFGPFIWNGPRSIYHYHIWKLEPVLARDFNVRYFHLYLLEKTAEIKAAGHGVSMLHMTKEKMERLFVPLPPIGEQARIVARVDELMRLCDDLEAKGRLEVEQHARLLDTLLGTLTDSSTPEELAANWQRVATHFDLLLDRPEAVDALERGIVQLALDGLLTQRDRSLSWSRIRLGDVLKDLRYGTSAKCSYGGQGVPVLRIPNLREGSVDTSDLKFAELDSRELASLRLERGDLLLIRSNGSAGLVGTAALVSSDLKGFAYAGYLVRARLDRERVLPEFVALMLTAPDIRRQIEEPIRTTSGVKNINSGEISRLSFLLPPLKAQDAIVTRVTELRRLCTNLRARLATQQTVQSHLADALVEQALA
jgi:type I restriction enzyme, S subunit